MFNLIYETKWKISTKEIIQILFTIYTKLFGIVVFIAFLISFLLASYRMIQKRLNFLKIEILLLTIIAYQISISVLAFHMPVYNSSIYIVYLVVLYLLFQKTYQLNNK